LQVHNAEFYSRLFFGKMIENEATVLVVVVIKIPQVLIYFYFNSNKSTN
jgi:hypothetical protein